MITMKTKYNESVLEFLIEKAIDRSKSYPTVFPMDCEENVLVFDQLDYLTEEELEPIHVIFLLGSELDISFTEALEKAKQIGFSAVEIIAFEPRLNEILQKGLVRLKEYERLKVVKN